MSEFVTATIAVDKKVTHDKSGTIKTVSDDGSGTVTTKVHPVDKKLLDKVGVTS